MHILIQQYLRACFRSQVSEKYRKKIELMVRKPDKGEEPPDLLSPCPFCQLQGPQTELQCISCQNIIPFDISTGEHLAPESTAAPSAGCAWQLPQDVCGNVASAPYAVLMSLLSKLILFAFYCCHVL